MNEYFLPMDVARCNNSKCELRMKCARWLDIFPFHKNKYWYDEFPDKDCKYFIEKDGIEPIKNERT